MKQRNISQTAVAYFRTSSVSNVGEDKDSLKRQRAAVEAFSARHGYEILGDFYDAAVSGADAIEDRPGFAALLDRIESKGAALVARSFGPTGRNGLRQ
jgi:DNA invertase Pin-like site-specific DNA recombinase